LSNFGSPPAELEDYLLHLWSDSSAQLQTVFKFDSYKPSGTFSKERRVFLYNILSNSITARTRLGLDTPRRSRATPLHRGDSCIWKFR